MGERHEKEPVNEVDSHVAKKYEIRKRIGKGAYGIVWKAIDRKNGNVVAVKKIFDAFRNETDAQRTFREIVFLLEFSAHPNVIRLHNVLKAENHKDIYLVFPYMETDLHNVIRKGGVLEDIHHRYIMYQLFRAIKYLHSGSVIHRDLKPSNVLVNSDCKVKVADFGLARSIDPSAGSEPNGDPTLTNYVATRWYRAPEILLNSKTYTVGIDMWSLGCILAEMLLGHPLFPGSSTLDQIEKIMNVIKTPTQEDLKFIPSHLATNLTHYLSSEAKSSLREVLKDAPADALNLIEKLLIFNPNKRPMADEALRHPYVARFRNILNEPSFDKAITPCIRDDIQLSVDIYRNKLYELIASKKNRDKPETKDDSKSKTNKSVDKSTCSVSSSQNYMNKTNDTLTTSKPISGHKNLLSRDVGRSRNGSIVKSHNGSNAYISPIKSRTAETSQAVKVTVVARSLERKSRDWGEILPRKNSRDRSYLDGNSNKSEFNKTTKERLENSHLLKTSSHISQIHKPIIPQRFRGNYVSNKQSKDETKKDS